MILVALLMFATLGVLFAGLFGLVRGGGNPARSNRLMRWRVILQGAALLLFALLMTLLTFLIRRGLTARGPCIWSAALYCRCEQAA